MRKSSVRALSSVGLAFALLVGSAGNAFAANVDTTRVPQVIRGVGSDTLFEVQSDLDQIYNRAVGCAVIPSTNPGATVQGSETCFDPNDTTGSNNAGDPGILPYAGGLITNGNLYHDVAAEYYPVGSGGGTKILSAFATGTNLGGEPGLPAAFARASSKQTYAVSGYQAYGVAYGRDGAGYWVGKTNTNVAQGTSGPAPNATLADLTGVFVGVGGGQCLINWSTSTSDSIGAATGAPGSGSIDVFATQPFSGSGKDFLQKIDPAHASSYSDASALQNCVPSQYKDGDPTNGEHVLVENFAGPICNQQGSKTSFQSTAIYPYAYLRFIQNKASSGTCAGVLGKVNGIAPTITSLSKVSGTGSYPMGSYRYNYFLLPNPLPSGSCTGRDGTTVSGVDLNNRNTWTVSCGLTAQQVATLDYLAPNFGFLCRASGIATDPFTGLTYLQLIQKKLKADGIAPLKSGSIGGTTWTGTSYCRDAAAT